MNAIEIEQAISTLAEQPFEAEEFPYAFLKAFGNEGSAVFRGDPRSNCPGIVVLYNLGVGIPSVDYN
jgi:hypothetical protein